MIKDTAEETYYHERRVLKTQVEALRSALAIAQVGCVVLTIIGFAAGYLIGTK